MTAPAIAPTQETSALLETISMLMAKVEELEAQVAIHEKRLDKHSEYINDLKPQIEDQGELLKNHDARLNKRSYKLYEKRLTMTDEILVKAQNRPVSFSDMGKLQGFVQKTRRQSMTKLGHVYERFPNKYEVINSKLGGKTVRLNPAYYSKLIKAGV